MLPLLLQNQIYFTKYGWIYHPLRLRLDRFWGGGAEGLSPLFVCARATLHWWMGLEPQQVTGF
eukprot:COSAG06_NODE_366_length_16768_cov_145.097246_14_plen_63_part_00